MINTDLLKQKIKNAGTTITFIAKKIGVSREGLYKKLSNETEFKASEICAVTNLLHLSDEERNNIFFGPICEFNSHIGKNEEEEETWTNEKFLKMPSLGRCEQ